MTDQGERPTRPALTRDRVLRHALRIVDTDGLHALTMRRLGAELDVDPMAVYRHVPNKAQLLDGVTELLWAQAFDPAAFGAEPTWKDQFFSAMCRFREILLEHPKALPLMATHPLVTPEQYATADRALAALEEAGLVATPQTLYLVVDAVNYTVGHVLAEAGEPAGGAGGQTSGQDVARLVADLPHVARLVQALLDDDPGSVSSRWDEQYRMGLRAMLDGWPECTHPHG